jgi:hypothetical protein
MNNDNTLDRETALQLSYRRNWLSNQIAFWNAVRTYRQGDTEYLGLITQRVINYQVEYQAIATLLRANGYKDLINNQKRGVNN